MYFIRCDVLCPLRRQRHVGGLPLPCARWRSRLALMNDLASDHGRQYLALRDVVLLLRIENVAAQDHEIGQLADFERASVLLLKRPVGARERVSLDRFPNADLLL